MAQAFVPHWVANYGTPLWLLSDKGKQVAAKLFTHTCETIGTPNLSTASDHAQRNGHVDWFNETLLKALRNYIQDHPKD